MKSRKQTIVTMVILGMPYNFSIYIVLAGIIFTMQLVQYSPLCITQVRIDRDYHTTAAAGDGFIPSSLPNSRRKFAIPAKIKFGVDKGCFVIFISASRPTKMVMKIHNPKAIISEVMC
jgi:hypothetical protein